MSLISTTEALEALIDKHGLVHVLTGLELVCEEKAEHIRHAWQDRKTAAGWDSRSSPDHRGGPQGDRVMAATTQDTLSMWTVYRSPRDYPGKYVARRFELDRPTHGRHRRRRARQRAGADGAARTYRLDRYPDDDPVIVEVWL